CRMNIFFSSAVSWSHFLSSSGHGVSFASCGITPSRFWFAKIVSRNSFQNAIHVTSCATIVFDEIDAVGHQAASGDKKFERGNCGQLLPCGKHSDQFDPGGGCSRRASTNNKAAIRQASESTNGTFNVAMRADWPDINSKRGCYRLDHGKLPNAGSSC